jgi:UDP-glucose 4-epimerase
MAKIKLTYDRILVTGGAGFVGSHTVDALLENNTKVWVLDDLSTGSLANLGKWKHTHDLRFIRGSVVNLKRVEALARRTDAIIHLAAVVSPFVSMTKPRLTNMVNVTGTLSILEAGLRAHAKRIVYASSSSVYGNSSSHDISEKTPTAPITPYGVSKLAAEKYCHAFYAEYGLPTVSLRYFNVYGERQSSNPYSGVIAIFAKRLLVGMRPKIYGDGNQVRDFIHVSDIVTANLLALESQKATGITLNIGTGKAISIKTLASTLSALIGMNDIRPVYVSPRPGDIGESCANISMAVKLLGFHPRVHLQQGLRLVVEWMRQRGAVPG